MSVAFASAQEYDIVSVGDISSYFVDEHDGSEYKWIVFTEPTLSSQADEADVDFTAGNTGRQIDIQWRKPGTFYISVDETNFLGCINTKVMAVIVVPAEHSIGFETTTGSSCFYGSENGFILPLRILDNNGASLSENYFPIKLKFEVNGQIHTESIDFNNKQVFINDEWFHIGSEQDNQITVDITEAVDVNNVSLKIATGIFTQTIYAIPELWLIENTSDTIALNSFHAFEASFFPDYSYNWWYEDETGNTISLSSESNVTEDVLWSTSGKYTVFVQATDVNGCLSEINSKSFTVAEVQRFIPSLVALPDINVGYENNTISGNVSINDFDFLGQNYGFIYSLISDPIQGLTFFEDGTYDYTPPANFTGTVHFSYKVCYENYYDECAQTNVEINVLPLNSDENLAPVAATDAALTLPNQTVFSNLAANDIDPDGFGAPIKVITEPIVAPSGGTVIIEADGSFAYTPDLGFLGIDRFQYRICDNGNPTKCDSAWVYIFVDNFGDTGHKPISASDDVFLHVAEGIYSLRNNDYDLLGVNLVYNTKPLIPPSHGILEIYQDGTFTYFPDDGFTGADWFVYEVCNTDNPPVCRQGTGFILVTPGKQWVELAGSDTIIGKCSTFNLNGLEVGTGFNYSWSPGHLLDDSTIVNPEWQPDETTIFTLTVTNDYGFSKSDSVTITVTDVVADAGEDVYVYSGENAVLDGSDSNGANLHYFWTTENGIIESGAETANPVVSGFGNYILKVTDSSGCTDTDTVTVERLTFAPIAQDDYDSTDYRSVIEIYVLDNDYDADSDIDSMSLEITVPPINGTANIDFSNFSIKYNPKTDFSGTDYFEYRICDAFENCDEATVYVLVDDYRFFIPNAFSPNGDGINDYFEIVGIEFYPGNSIEIFNRWGNRVYKAQNYGIENSPTYWDGKANTGVKIGNEDLPTGTYFYVLNLGNGEKRIVGSVYLDR